jgi:hypothetical protein
LANGARTNGNKFTVSTKYQQSWFTATNAVYGFKSYGGNAYGDQLKLEQRVSDRLGLYENGEATHYDKITSSNRWAFSSQAGFQYWLSNPFKVTLGGEFNSNNILRYDARVIAKVTYSLWSEI